ncbi:MAG: glycine/D-amino acid oxidase-like deaminating enzyme [Lysobacterales bacterium]|jgi:glycine/D-amino acid oxidase-like deaminating enzyme
MPENYIRAEIVICGAGIAGIAAAYYLSVHYGCHDIILIDRDQPMSYTSSKSGENFRDYWPQECMHSLMTRSIDLMEALATECDDCFGMRYGGYDFVSFDRHREIFPSQHLRQNQQSIGLDQIVDKARLRSEYPYLSNSVKQLVHINRAGPMDVHALGSYMLAQARATGVRLHTGHIERLETQSGRFIIDTSKASSRSSISADRLVLAAGPMNQKLAGMLGVEMNIQSILQRKFVIPDPLKIIPREMPYTIFADPQHLQWSDEERNLIQTDPEYQWLLNEFSGGLHIKPVSFDQIKLGWAFNRESTEPVWQPADDFDFPNVVLRGASRFIPGLAAYVDQVPTPIHQISGYYSRTKENWPVIGPLAEHANLFTIAALSGFGTMAACASGDLLAQWMLGLEKPGYARHFHPERYKDPEIMAEIEAIESDGQL